MELNALTVRSRDIAGSGMMVVNHAHIKPHGKGQGNMGRDEKIRIKKAATLLLFLLLLPWSIADAGWGTAPSAFTPSDLTGIFGTLTDTKCGAYDAGAEKVNYTQDCSTTLSTDQVKWNMLDRSQHAHQRSTDCTLLTCESVGETCTDSDNNQTWECTTDSDPGPAVWAQTNCVIKFETVQVDGTLNGTANEVEILNWVGFDISGSGSTRTITRSTTNGLTTNVIGISAAGFSTDSDDVIVTDGVLHLTAIYLNKGTTVTSITYLTGTAGITTPANWWFALYNSSLSLLANSTDQTTTAWAANTVKTLNMITPYVVTASGVYYAGIMINATNPMPDIRGMNGNSTVNALVLPIQTGNSTTGLTTTPPATAAALTAVADIPMVLLK